MKILVSSDPIFIMGKSEQLFVFALVQSYPYTQTFKKFPVFCHFLPKILKSLKVHPGTKLKVKQEEKRHHDRTQ
jgi:hypothetical protein